MADLSIEIFYHCLSVEAFQAKVDGSNGKKYTVSYGRTPNGPYQRGWSCNCEAFRYRKVLECKHIKAVKGSGSFCGWTQFTDGDKPKIRQGNALCPKCGRKAIAMKWAV